jgi:hypothetical protein
MFTNPRTVTQYIASLALCVVGGCSVLPWHSDEEAPHHGDAVSHWQTPAPLAPAEPAQNADAATPLHQPRVLPMNEQLSLMSQRVASAEDDRKVLASRMHIIELQLEEKEKALAAAKLEIQESTTQVVHARNELQQWQKESKALREKMTNMERDNRDTLEATIKTLEQVLERDRETPKGPEIRDPEVLTLPKHP